MLAIVEHENLEKALRRVEKNNGAAGVDLWQQWKQPATRKRRLIEQGLTEERAWKSASNGRGAWWNSGASHMNEAFPTRFFDLLGLVSLQAQQLKLSLV